MLNSEFLISPGVNWLKMHVPVLNNLGDGFESSVAECVDYSKLSFVMYCLNARKCMMQRFWGIFWSIVRLNILLHNSVSI